MQGGLDCPDLTWELTAPLQSLSQETKSKYGLSSPVCDGRASHETLCCFSVVVKIFHSAFDVVHTAFESPQTGVLTKGI